LLTTFVDDELWRWPHGQHPRCHTTLQGATTTIASKTNDNEIRHSLHQVKLRGRRSIKTPPTRQTMHVLWRVVGQRAVSKSISNHIIGRCLVAEIADASYFVRCRIFDSGVKPIGHRVLVLCLCNFWQLERNHHGIEW
jgi:hypothetical protein